MITIQGVIDRIEDGNMVVIAEKMNREFIFSTQNKALKAGDWVIITSEDGIEVTSICVDDEKTSERRKRLEQLKRSLKRRDTR